MACYKAWNGAIAAYFMSGAAKGSSIFLSLDSEAIEDVAARFIDEPVSDDPRNDFVAAVRRRCVQPTSERVNINNLRAKIEGIPSGVAFLGLMVFAAYNMQEEEGIDESNYFLRLREVLGVPRYRGRPEGMPAGAEEPLCINGHKWA